MSSPHPTLPPPCFPLLPYPCSRYSERLTQEQKGSPQSTVHFAPWPSPAPTPPPRHHCNKSFLTSPTHSASLSSRPPLRPPCPQPRLHTCFLALYVCTGLPVLLEARVRSVPSVATAPRLLRTIYAGQWGGSACGARRCGLKGKVLQTEKS